MSAMEPMMSTDYDLDALLNEHFAGRVVRKDLTKLIKEGEIGRASCRERV